jgi:hypothetical protein
MAISRCANLIFLFGKTWATFCSAPRDATAGLIEARGAFHHLPEVFQLEKWCEKPRGTWGFHHEKENISPKKGLVHGAPETRNKQDGGVIMSNNMGMIVYSHIDICNRYV